MYKTRQKNWFRQTYYTSTPLRPPASLKNWVDERAPAASPADLPELLSLGRVMGATSHVDELFLNNLSNVVDTNRLCSNTKKACLTCLFLLNNIPVDNPATFLEESFPLIVVQGSAKSWGKTSRCGVSRPESLRCNSIEMWVHFYEVPKS